jgi:Domain of unknown function (DUF4327)
MMPVTYQQYCITDFQDEVRALVARGSVSRQQRIYELRPYFSDHEWQNVKQLLAEEDYLLRDPVIDSIGKESWLNDD